MRASPIGTLAVALALVATAALAADKKNLLKPANKVDSWRFEQHEQGKGTIKADGDAIALETTEAGGESWHVQAVMAGIGLTDGKEYEVKFKAKADPARSVSLNAMIDEDDWHTIGLTEEIELTKDWKDYAFTFKADGVAKENKNRLSFIIGGDKGKVWVKDMTLTEK